MKVLVEDLLLLSHQLGLPDRGVLEARVVVLALGIGNADLVDVPYGREKRQLFVLDLPVDVIGTSDGSPSSST